MIYLRDINGTERVAYENFVAKFMKNKTKSDAVASRKVFGEWK
jgi:hypothetical protein